MVRRHAETVGSRRIDHLREPAGRVVGVDHRAAVRISLARQPLRELGDGFEKWENQIRNPSRAGWNRHDDERDANGNSGWSRDWKNCRNCVPANRERGCQCE